MIYLKRFPFHWEVHMTEGNFVDYVKIYAASGNGGKGSIHLHREKYITKGGPDGGDGGRDQQVGPLQDLQCHLDHSQHLLPKISFFFSNPAKEQPQ